MPSCTLSLRVASIIALLFAGCGMRSDMTITTLDDSDAAIPSGGTSSTSSTAGAAGGASATAIPSGGVSTIPSGGASAIPSGGASMTASRTSSSLPSGGASAIAGSRASGGTSTSTKTGGTSASSRTGGAGMLSGGTTVLASSGAGGSSRASVSSPPNCTGVVCPVLPKTCKNIVQDPTACCPVCTDTGCPPCGDIKCAPGTHLEALPGDCCPTCVADPLDACKKGQKAYEELRKQLLDKYGSPKCQNTSDCTLVQESNACTTVCNVPMPTSWAGVYSDNLNNSAKNNCASCPVPPPVMCERMVASCLNGKCVAVNPS